MQNQYMVQKSHVYHFLLSVGFFFFGIIDRVCVKGLPLYVVSEMSMVPLDLWFQVRIQR